MTGRNVVFWWVGSSTGNPQALEPHTTRMGMRKSIFFRFRASEVRLSALGRFVR